MPSCDNYAAKLKQQWQQQQQKKGNHKKSVFYFGYFQNIRPKMQIFFFHELLGHLL